MARREKIVHRITVGGQPVAPSRPGTLALRKSRLIRRRVRNLFYTAGFVLSTLAITQAGYGFFMEAPYFAVTAPTIEGVSDNVRKEITGLVSSFIQNQPSLLAVDTRELEKQIALHPRVRDIRVMKVYPNRLKITAVEREEVAIAATQNGFYLIDNECHVMDKLNLNSLPQFDLPFIAGLPAETVHEGEVVESSSLKKALLLIQVLKAHNEFLYDQISEVEIQQEKVSPLETLVMHMKGGLDILLGDGNPVDKLPALETLFKKFDSEKINPFSDLVYIDLSYEKLGFYMDKETALIVKSDQYDIVQRAMQEASDKYAKTYTQQKTQSAEPNTAAAAAPRRPAAGRVPTARSADVSGAAQAPYPQRTSPYQQQPAASYQQQYQQYYRQNTPVQGAPAQYRQQQAPAALYNMPNQPR